MCYCQYCKKGNTSCSCSIALWSSPAVIARLYRAVAGIKTVEERGFGVCGGDPVTPERRIEETRLETGEDDNEGDSEGISKGKSECSTTVLSRGGGAEEASDSGTKGPAHVDQFGDVVNIYARCCFPCFKEKTPLFQRTSIRGVMI